MQRSEALEGREDFRVQVGRETVRLWLRDAGLEWRRPHPVIRPKDPDREKKLSALRALLQGLPGNETAVFMDVHRIHRLSFRFLLQGHFATSKKEEEKKSKVR